ncbi:hypothetical protein ACFQZ4_31995 [Catellatospora coxensis]
MLAELFALTGDDLDELWPGAVAAHEEWLARRAAQEAGSSAVPESAGHVPAARAAARPAPDLAS